MAAVTGGLTERNTVTLAPVDAQRSPGDVTAQLGGLGDFGRPMKALPTLAQMHANLTRMVWIRRVLELWAAQRRFQVVQSAEPGANSGQLVFRLDQPMPKAVIPWMTATRDWYEFALWGESGKMACPTWDLPAGGLSIGGSCPGADAAQTVTPPERRRGRMVDIQTKIHELEQRGDPRVVVLQRAYEQGRRFILPADAPGTGPVAIREEATVCESCYAFEGNYPSPHVQMGEVLRFWWVAEMLRRGRLDELVDTLVLSMQLLRYPATPMGILPVRIHSAGDFFRYEYAEAWVAVANRLWDAGGASATVRMWAPSRTWASPGWVERWPELVAKLHGPNLIVRPSAYHFDDIAPEALSEGGPRGSTSLMESTDASRPRGQFRAPPGQPRYDWACPTYALEEEKHVCSNATAPPGEGDAQGKHCRACWTHPEWRVQYTAH